MSAPTFHILDVDLTLNAPPDALASFDLLYHRLRSPCPCAICGGLPRTALQIDVSEPDYGTCAVNSPWGMTEIAPDRVLSHLFHLLQHHLVGGIRGFFAIHGAALQIDGRGCVLAAPSATGKSTLAAALVQRGAGFLSDEVAALDLRQPVLHGFHRHLALRQPAVRLLDRTADPTVGIAGEPKSIIDPQSLNDGSLLIHTTPDVIILLAPPPDPSATPADDEQILELFLLQEGTGFADRIAALDGVRAVHRLPGRRLPALRILQDRAAALIDPIDAAATATGTLISGHHRGASLPIDYTRPPQCTPLDTSAGLLHLLPTLLNRHGLHPLGTPVQWLFTLSHLLANTRFYRLTPGPLTDTADTVRLLCAAGTPPDPKRSEGRRIRLAVATEMG